MKSLETSNPAASATSDDGIVVHLDGQPHRVPLGTTLADLVEQLGHAPQAVSTAVNGEFVARATRQSRQLAADDVVLLFQPIVGG